MGKSKQRLWTTVYCGVCGLNNPETANYCRNCGSKLIEASNVKIGASYPTYRTMKRYVCVKVTHHKHVADTIHDYQQEGWMLHTYSTAGGVGGGGISVFHYLLFEKD